MRCTGPAGEIEDRRGTCVHFGHHHHHHHHLLLLLLLILLRRAAASAAKNIKGRWQRLVKKAMEMQRARDDVLGLR
jgi:hypothetical protein